MPSQYSIEGHIIRFPVPPAPENRRSMLGFACDPIPHVRVGLIGLGMRGPGAVDRFLELEDASIVAICDLYPAPVEEARKRLVEGGAPEPKLFIGPDGYKRLCEEEGIDLVYVAVPWHLHTPIALYAMEHGKHVALEVPAATTVAECWALVDTAERTRRHCMMLENSCYDFFELSCLHMVQQGLFGEIVHAEGAYCHNLNSYWDRYRDDWSMKQTAAHRGDLYPTHGLGPICQALGIHRGDKLDLLVAMDSSAIAGQAIADARYGKGSLTFENGDLTATLMRTRKGKTLLLERSIVTPRPYSRMYQLCGTKGYAGKYPVPEILLGEEATECMEAAERDALLQRYRHPILEGLEEKARTVGGHGGIDYIMDYRLIYCLHHGLPLDQDVYDAAEWSSVVELTEASLRNGCLPVEMPDFTRGEWDRLQGVRFATAPK